MSLSLELLPDQADVVIIGAGASGIAALRQLSTTTKLSLICLDSRSSIGGVWNYEPDPGPCKISFDESGRPHLSPPRPGTTPMYDGLRTNVPKELMAFKTQAFEDHHGSFPPHHDVLEYLQQSVIGLEEYVALNVEVKRVYHKPTRLPTSRRWVVEVMEKSKTTRPLYCDYVIAANGHNSAPHLPALKGLNTWPHQILHSFFYRNPNDKVFTGKRAIAVVGLGPSGYDLIHELAIEQQNNPDQHHPKLYALSAHPPPIGYDLRDPKAPAWTRFIEAREALESISDSVLNLSDGTKLDDVDLICFATGYRYAFDFCSTSDQPWSRYPLLAMNENESGRRVHHLDRLQTFYFPDPSFAFLALVTSVVPFPLAEFQARAIGARWSKKSEFELFPFENEEEESSSVHVLRPPKEYEVENELLRLIGEGTKTGKGWSDVEDWKITARLESNERRKRELGY